jgi:hypothetical protein
MRDEISKDCVVFYFMKKRRIVRVASNLVLHGSREGIAVKWNERKSLRSRILSFEM